MQQPWPACRSAKGGLYAWSQSTPNLIILERVSCVSSTERLFTCAEPRCYFASPSVFIMMALFCPLVGGGYEHAIAWSYVILPYEFSMFCVWGRQCVCLQLSRRSLFWKFKLSPAVTVPPATPVPQIMTYISEWRRFRNTNILDLALHQLPSLPVGSQAWLAVCFICVLCVYCEECYLNRTCQTQWTNLELWATIVFFPSTHLHNSHSKRMKTRSWSVSTHLLCTFLYSLYLRLIPMFTVIYSVCLVQSEMNIYTIMFGVTPYFNSPLINGYTHHTVVISQQLELVRTFYIIRVLLYGHSFHKCYIDVCHFGTSAHLQESDEHPLRPVIFYIFVTVNKFHKKT